MDLDDALSVRVLPNGKLELGVHIADPTHFVGAGSRLDVEAQRRCETLYARCGVGRVALAVYPSSRV